MRNTKYVYSCLSLLYTCHFMDSYMPLTALIALYRNFLGVLLMAGDVYCSPKA